MVPEQTKKLYPNSMISIETLNFFGNTKTTYSQPEQIQKKEGILSNLVVNGKPMLVHNVTHELMKKI